MSGYVSVRLAGGLGNQLFQFAAALMICQRRSLDSVNLFCADLKSYQQRRDFSLGEVLDLNRWETRFSFHDSLILRSRVSKIGSHFSRGKNFIGDRNFLSALSIDYGNAFLDGYFQEVLDQACFDNFVDILKKYRRPAAHGLRFSGSSSCVIHIRGGDFLRLGWTDVASSEYYKRSIEWVSEKFGVDEFFVVSDDNEYAGSILEKSGVGYTFIGGSMVEDFDLIGVFPFRILSASTFALWANCLGSKKPSITIAPDYWRPGVPRHIKVIGEEL